MDPRHSDTEARLVAEAVAAAVAVERAITNAEREIANVHEVRACPRCKAPIGTRCENMTRTYQRGRELKHPHRERYAGMER